MKGEGFTPSIFPKNKKFILIQVKIFYFVVFLEFRHVQKIESFHASNITSGSWNLATESDVDHILTSYV